MKILAIAIAALLTVSSTAEAQVAGQGYGPGPLPTTSDDRILGQSGVPFVMVGSGLMIANGVGTLTTALAATPAITSAYCYFPVNAIATGVAAGWYYCLFTTTTAFTVFNNTYTSGTPAIPASPTPFSTTSPVSYTGSSSLITAYNYTLPGNILGLNGGIRINGAWSFTNSGNNKTIGVNFGAMALFNVSETANASLGCIWGVKNAGATGLQLATSLNGNGCIGVGTSALPSGTVDTTAAVLVSLTMQNGTPASNNIVQGPVTIELLPGVP